jgi:hypothetical protein
MNGNLRDGYFYRLGFMAVLMLSVISLKADPISVGESPLEHTVFIPITLAILLEAICICLILRRLRRPRLFILWLMGMHLLTYPLFLGWLWLSYGMHPAFAVALGEGAIVFIEGGLIYLICRFISSGNSPLPVPSISKSLFASLIGNICSAAAFPVLLMAYGKIVYSMMSSNMD